MGSIEEAGREAAAPGARRSSRGRRGAARHRFFYFGSRAVDDAAVNPAVSAATFLAATPRTGSC